MFTMFLISMAQTHEIKSPIKLYAWQENQNVLRLLSDNVYRAKESRVRHELRRKIYREIKLFVNLVEQQHYLVLPTLLYRFILNYVEDKLVVLRFCNICN